MKVLLVVGATRYTGAAAIAEHDCRALAAVGVETELLFIGGNNLEERLKPEAWARPELVKERSLGDLRQNLKSLRRHAEDARVVIAHLPSDHTLCKIARLKSILVRDFRHPRHLRRTLHNRWLAGGLAGAKLANRDMRASAQALVGTIPCASLPVPLEARFQPGSNPSSWRRRLAIPENAPVIGTVGKVAANRGFDLLLDTAAALGRDDLRVLIVGHGEARPGLEAQARSLGVSVAWAGYQEDDLPELYAAMNVVIFPAPGSDHGHRMISEAQGCGRPVVAIATSGVEDLISDGSNGLLAPANARALADRARRLLESPSLSSECGHAAADAVADRRFERVGETLRAWLDTL